MANICNLPPFGEGVFPPPDEAGVWVKSPGSLTELARSLRVDPDRPGASHATTIRAIPDPWAQARTFADAVLDEGHSMHKAAIPQWRGLLALFALAELRKVDYVIDVDAVELGNEHPFDLVLQHLAPKTAIGGEADLWLTPHIVYVQPARGRRVPIAMLNPACLVSPGRTTWQMPVEFVPWLQHGLSDPLDLRGEQALASGQLAALEAYLEALQESLPLGRADPTGGAIRQAVAEFLDAVVEAKGVGTIGASVLRTPDGQLPAIYRSLVLPAELEEPDDPAKTSQCRLKLKHPAGLDPFKGLILVDESIATSCRRSARDILVWGNHSLSELLGSPNMLHDVQAEAAERGYLVVTAKDVFTKRMVKLRNDARIPGHGPELRNCLEPIRPLALLLDQTGTRGLEASHAGKRSTITLHVKLESGDSVPLLANYRTDQDSEFALVPDVDWDFGQASIWPDFKSRQWTSYFARIAYATLREQVRPRFALSADILAAALAAAASPRHAVQALQAINENQAPAERESYFNRFQYVSDKTYEELQVSDRAFEGIFYVDYHPDRSEELAGFARLKLAEPTERDNRVSVAVDFGSTNSVACFSGAGGTPVTLKQRIVHPISFQDPARQDAREHDVRWFYVDFLPLKDRQTPTPTVVISRVDANRNADLWLHRNLIYFQPAGGHVKGEAEKELGKLQSYLKRSSFDLKWNEDPSHIDASADFLEQFMTMIAAEATAAEYDPRRIDWHFSVPDAMQDTRLRSFRAQVELAQRRLSPEGSLHDLYSEGLAAARYILSGREGSKFTQGTINAILDIGGSTTDITLWGVSEKQPLWKGSFRLAGRAFFTDAIVQNSDILREIELGDWADLIDPQKQNQVLPENVSDVGELLFSRPALSEAFDKHWQRRLNVKTGEMLRVTSLVYLAGIAYYLGLVSRRLVADGVIQEADLARPAFALCGRGAGLFNRIHGGLAADRSSPVTVALQTFSKAAAIEALPRPQLFISPQPKIEVVAGMMVNFENLDARVGNGQPLSDYLPAGLEVLVTSGNSIEAGDTITTPFEVGSARGSDLASLQDFLSALEEFTGIQVDLRQASGQGAFNEISTEVRQRVERQRAEDGRLALKEPPFITALRALVSILAGPADERSKRLAVELGS